MSQGGISPERPVVVIGAGIVGVCCAAYLVREGLPVVLTDRRGPGEMTSFGNLGGIQNLAATPIALPGMLRDVPRWLLDPDGPLHVRPAYLPQVLPWLWRFWRQSEPERVLHNAKALNDLNRRSAECHLELARWAGLEHLFKIPGQLYLWTSRAYYDQSTFSRRIWASTGQPFDEIGPAEIREMEPGLAPVFEVGLRIPGNGYCRDPFGLAKGLAAKAVSEGAQFIQAEANGFRTSGGMLTGVETDRGVIDAGAVVLALGMWSKRLASSLGYHVPLESHRGYHVTIANPGIQLGSMCLVIDKKVAITPMTSGLRIGGTVEFAGLDALPDYRRARQFLALGKQLISGLDTSTHQEWMGHRPCLPDSLPVIGRTQRFGNLYCAFGHGHMGLLGSAPTGSIIADLIAGRSPSTQLEPFRIERF
ncbi:NAD(P)/FAD-dependent oxidoreductase [Rhodoligotrophos ferricapiens]|uniref:NAD(P)/FAD-dependent oxidoreductase n=1 Tax=Rhodoligotrophos ferricapiens TaxID=3069264 RepID=UPI00315D424C